MIHTTFEFVATTLRDWAEIFGVTYKEMNIIVYIIAIPMVWAYMIDKAFNFHYLKAAHLVFLLLAFGIAGTFENNCNGLFLLCQLLLCTFYPIGIDYTTASVIFCVIAPVIFHIWLMRYTQKKRQRKETSQEET